MSKFIEVTAGTKILINTDEIARIEPTKDYKDGSEVCVITLIHTTKHSVEGRKFITKESYEEVKQMIIGTKQFHV